MIPKIIRPSAVSSLDHSRVAEPVGLSFLTMATAILIDGASFSGTIVLPIVWLILLEK